jgi:hypothetical protein
MPSNDTNLYRFHDVFTLVFIVCKFKLTLTTFMCNSIGVYVILQELLKSTFIIQDNWKRKNHKLMSPLYNSFVTTKTKKDVV